MSTPIPVLAYIAFAGGRGVSLRDGPAGTILGYLTENAPVHILYRRETVNNIEWIEIQDVLDHIGWVQTEFLINRP